jgi:capsule polysaccharide export protein KpsE/RkpR
MFMLLALWCVFALAETTRAADAPQPPVLDETQIIDKSIENARADMVAAAREAYTANVRRLRGGRASIEQVYLWSRRWMDAASQGQDQATRLAEAESHLERMQQRMDRAGGRRNQDADNDQDPRLHATKFYIAEARKKIADISAEGQEKKERATIKPAGMAE